MQQKKRRWFILNKESQYMIYQRATEISSKENVFYIIPVLTASPNNWKRARSPFNTPAVTGPLCKPINFKNKKKCEQKNKLHMSP